MSILLPAGWLYGLATDLRNFLYNRGIFKSHSLGAKTISIGNLTTGGTGKTPLVAYVANVLAESGETVCVLTRGYGRSEPHDRVVVSDGESVLVNSRVGGDEPVELALRLLGMAVVIADADRVSAAKFALREFGVTAFVLDDGFQHRRAKRDIDIVCIDATDPFGKRELLPAGRLRERLRNLIRADIAVITRADLVKDISKLRAEISNIAPVTRIFSSANKLVRLTEMRDFQESLSGSNRSYKASTPDQIKGQGSFAFCGLGNPLSFFRHLKSEGFSLHGEKAFADHHPYSQRDIDLIEKEAQAAGAEYLVTTAKDAVRLKDLDISMNCFVAEIDLTIENEEDFRRLISVF